MIIRERRLGTVGRVLAYVTRSGRYRDRADEVAAPAYLLNAGLTGVGDIPLPAAMAVVIACANSRPGLKNRALHLVVSPAPDHAQRRGQPQSRQDCLATLTRAMRAIGAEDRIALAVFHGAGHGRDKAQHLHAVIALPSPETGKSVPQHRLRERLKTVALGMQQEIELTLSRDMEVPQPLGQNTDTSQTQEGDADRTPPPAQPEPPQQAPQKPRRKRRRQRVKSRGMEL
ncbi:MAG: hypothetical protein RIE87_13820 [Rhodospirillales bacterium]|tara:strand:+ start:575 stop:1261 length:687 start_codon:yes stop_codon:yes gene_type:complete